MPLDCPCPYHSLSSRVLVPTGRGRVMTLSTHLALQFVFNSCILAAAGSIEPHMLNNGLLQGPTLSQFADSMTGKF